MRDVVERVLDLVARLERESGFDWRTSWSRVLPGEPGRVIVELSRRELLDRIVSVEGGPGPVTVSSYETVLRRGDGPEVVLRLAGAGGDTRLWVVSSVADLRRQPDHGSELISQAIMGEGLTELERRGDWYFVRMDDDYHGWVRSWYVAETQTGRMLSFAREADARVEASVAYVLSTPDSSSIPVTDVTAGTPVIRGASEGGYIGVTLPGGRSGYIAESALVSPAVSDSIRERIVERARHFAGVTYVWGGTSGKGFDCSGLIKRVFLMEGIELPRDADQQSLIGERIGLEALHALRPADLVFFGESERITHVAIAMGGGKFIHAYGDVRVNSYIEGDPLYEDKLAGKLLFATRVIGEDA